MQEDVAGAIAAGTGRSYATCAECGQVFIRRVVRAEPSGLSGIRSEFTELCPECERLARQGESPIPTDPEE